MIVHYTRLKIKYKYQPLLPRAGVYYPKQTLNNEFYIAGESYTGLCLAILK